MEENQNPEQFNVTGQKKKGLGPVKGLLLAILIVFLLCVVGLLIRMVIAGDGDYFKPIKQICGIEDEEDDEDEDELNKTTQSSISKQEIAKNSFESSERYTMLSNDVEDYDVKHYRMTIDVKEMFDMVMEEFKTVNNGNQNKYDSNYDSKNEISNTTSNFKKTAYLDNTTVNSNNTNSSLFDNSLSSTMLDNSSNYNDSFGGMMSMALGMMDQMANLVDGEMYLDIYFKENKIIQIVLGYDYGPILENVYNLYAGNEDMAEEGIESVDDLAEYIVEEFDEYLDKDMILSLIKQEAGDDFEDTLKELGLKEKDIKEAFDISNEEGLIEVYFNGTEKMNLLWNMFILGGKDELASIEKEVGIKIDEDNVIESLIKVANKYIKLSKEEANIDIDLEFVEVR